MRKPNLEYAENLIRKAEDLVSISEKALAGVLYSNVIANCQEAIELSAKAIFKIMGLDFPKEHQLLFEKEGKEEIKEVTKKLLSMEFPKYFIYKDELPRVIFLSYFWHRFYTIAKYGISELNLPPDRLFKKEEAELALNHAKLCVRIAENLLYAKKDEVKT